MKRYLIVLSLFLVGTASAFPTKPTVNQIHAGTSITITGTQSDPIINASGGGGGTVTSASVVTANGLAGTVATATTTPAITLTTTVTGLLKGNGMAISAATAGTDYQAAGAYITALTGAITAAGPGSSAASITDGAVTPSKIGGLTAANILFGAGGGGLGQDANLTWDGTNIVLPGTHGIALGANASIAGDLGGRFFARSNGGLQELRLDGDALWNNTDGDGTMSFTTTKGSIRIAEGDTNRLRVISGAGSSLDLAADGTTLLTSAGSFTVNANGSGTFVFDNTAGVASIVTPIGAFSFLDTAASGLITDGTGSVTVFANASATLHASGAGVATVESSWGGALHANPYGSVDMIDSNGGRFTAAGGSLSAIATAASNASVEIRDGAGSGGSYVVLDGSGNATVAASSGTLALNGGVVVMQSSVGAIITASAGAVSMSDAAGASVSIDDSISIANNGNYPIIIQGGPGDGSSNNIIIQDNPDGTGGGIQITSYNAGSAGITINSAGALAFISSAATITGPWSFVNNVAVTTAGQGLSVKEGANACQGASTLVGGTVVVSTSCVQANSRIFLTAQNVGGTVGFYRVSARTGGTSFTIASSNILDTSLVAWEIFN